MSYSPSLRKARMAQVTEQIRNVRAPHDRAASIIESLITASDGARANEIRPLDLRAPLPKEVFEEVRAEIEQSSDPPVPVHWSKGALLNVRNRGDAYVITLYPEEFDPRYPERAMTFPNTWTCQDFVSKWYARETADPRAR